MMHYHIVEERLKEVRSKTLEKLRAHRDYIKICVDAGTPEDDLCCDVRLQYIPGDGDAWDAHLHTGDSSYDTDHKGVWAANSVSASDGDDEIASVADALISDIIDAVAMEE